MVRMAVFTPAGYFSDYTCTHIHNTNYFYNAVIKQAFWRGRGTMSVRQPPALASQTFLMKQLDSSVRTSLVPALKDVWIRPPHSLWVWIKELFLCACNILQINTWNKHKCRIFVVFPTVFFTVGSFHWCSRKCSSWCVENEHQFAISSGDFLKIRFKTSSTIIWQLCLCKHL